MLGLRVGEVCGLSWPDVDLAAGTLKVRQQVQPVGKGRVQLAPLKTAASRRTLTLPAMLIATLKAHKVRQLEERLLAGARWVPGDLVFSLRDGRMVRPEQARHAFSDVLRAANVPQVKFHTLRHTAATLLLQDGTPLFDVSRILGHAEIGITANTYGHLVEDMTAGAAARMDRLLARAKG